MLSHQLAAGPAANVEGLVQVGELGQGLVLSAVIGLEREAGITLTGKWAGEARRSQRPGHRGRGQAASHD